MFTCTSSSEYVFRLCDRSVLATVRRKCDRLAENSCKIATPGKATDPNGPKFRERWKKDKSLLTVRLEENGAISLLLPKARLARCASLA